ncbi:MAG: hypothetical protein AAF485_15455, partial [Chloroflexota bacterium]
MAQHSLTVIGTASLDILHFAGQTVQTIGGAGLYTALAAQRAGGIVTLFAPKPAPVPERLQPAVNQLNWVGPQILPEALPRLEIEHHGDDQATLLGASWGAEGDLTPNRLLPDLSSQMTYLESDLLLPPKTPLTESP